MNKWVVSMLVFFLLAIQLGHTAAAAAVVNAAGIAAQAGESGTTQIYETAFSNANTSLSGASASKTFYFQMEDYWKASHAVINLDYKASPLLQGDYSSVTIMVNGTTFYSFRPTVNESDKQQLTIPVPTDLIVAGNNTVTIHGNIQTTDQNQICVPIDNQDNWLQLYDTSGVAVTYTNEASENSIRQFNEQFTGLDTVSGAYNAIAVPKQSEPVELEAAVQALSGFAKANSLKDKSIPMFEWGSDSLKPKKLIVVVALYDHLPDELRTIIGNEDLSSKALIKVLNTGGQSFLVVTSQSSELLVKAGRLLANQELVSQLNGSMKLVDESTEVDTPAVDVNKIVTLTEAGDRLTGVNHQEQTYYVSLPANRAIADASKLSLDFRYADNLDFDRSMVTILVNNTPIGSKKLTPELANGDNLTLNIPKNTNIAGNFTVTVAFDLELVNGGCITVDNQMPWAFIMKESLLQLNTKDRTDLLFNNYPNPFMRDSSFNQVAVVLPKEQDYYTLLAISSVFNMLGQYTEGNTGNVHFYNDQAGESELKDSNIIAIGTYHNNAIIQKYNDKLYFQYSPDGNTFMSNEKITLDADYGKRIGTLQLIESPYEAGHGLLAVTAASSEYYYLASKLLASESTKWQLFGDGIVTDKDGYISAFRFKKQAGEDQSTLIQDVIQRSDVLTFMIAIVLVLVLVLLSLILIIRKYRKKRGDER